MQSWTEPSLKCFLAATWNIRPHDGDSRAESSREDVMFRKSPGLINFPFSLRS
jgi:hypothetical protein